MLLIHISEDFCLRRKLKITVLVLFTLRTFTNLLISNFRRVLYVACFLLGNSPGPEFYMPTFRNTLSLPYSIGWYV